MTDNIPADAQLVLLPARTASEAARWGSVVMEYAAAFRPVYVARDLAGVDWRAYRHITLVQPSYWPENLPLIIKQANPAAELDRIPVDSPEALQLLLNVRIYYHLRYGPRTAFDWKQLWPPNKTLIGLHGRANGELEEADYPIFARARVEAVKLTSHATPASVKRLRAMNPDLFLLVRPMVAFVDQDQPRQIAPTDFVRWTAADVGRLCDEDPTLRYIEIHNEPNLRREGWGACWRDGEEFGEWFLQVLEIYRQRFPGAQLGFPGLSPGQTSEFDGRTASDKFLEQALPAAQQADWIGMHAYWVNDKEMADQELGFNFVRYRELFPEKLLCLTEFGNPRQSKPEVAQQYARYYAMLRHVPGLMAAFAYVVSTPNELESAMMAWRDEAGRDVGIAAEVGKREFIQDEPLPPPG